MQRIFGRRRWFLVSISRPRLQRAVIVALNK